MMVRLASPSLFKEHYECLRPAQQAMHGVSEFRVEAIACLAGLQAVLGIQDYSTCTASVSIATTTTDTTTTTATTSLVHWCRFLHTLTCCGTQKYACEHGYATTAGGQPCKAKLRQAKITCFF